MDVQDFIVNRDQHMRPLEYDLSENFNELVRYLNDVGVLDNVPVGVTAESEIASVSDAYHAPPRALTVFGKSTQTGTPTPDAPVPILSVDDLLLVLAGKNLLDRSTEEAGYINSVGGQSGGSGWLRSTYIPIAGGGTYTFTPNSNAGGSAYGCCYDANKSAIASSLFSSGPTTFTAPENARYVRVSYRDTSTNVQLEAGSTATDYMSYVTPITIPDLLPEGTSLRSLPDGTKDTLNLSYLRPSTRDGWAWYERELVYKLATPVTTTLDPIELPQLPAPTATVWCDGGSAQPTLVLEYVRDANATIAELSEAIADIVSG